LIDLLLVGYLLQQQATVGAEIALVHLLRYTDPV
jgi:hypothetical protein